ncbi:MAG: tetratricopeptide repeat protein, partial [Bacteroidota bacterium]
MPTIKNQLFIFHSIFCLLFLFLIPHHSIAQSAEELLEQGGKFYEKDQLDSANFFYEKAFLDKNSNIQIQALTGLVKVALLKADLEQADSLIQVAEKLITTTTVDLKPLCKFEIIKGEYYRKNSQFKKALRQHKSVVNLSLDLEGAELIHADALFYTALTFERLSVFDSSLFYIDKAYTLYKQHSDTTEIKFANIYNGLGVCYYRANRYVEAKKFYLKSKEVAENKLGPVSSDLAICLSNLSSISRAEENYREGIDYCEQALKIYNVLDDDNGKSS